MSFQSILFYEVILTSAFLVLLFITPLIRRITNRKKSSEAQTPSKGSLRNGHQLPKSR